MKFFFLFLLVAHASLKPCEPGHLADGPGDSTTAYVRLLRLIAVEKHLLEPELLEDIAKSETPLNPVMLDPEAFGIIDALVYQRAFAAQMKAGMNWEGVRAVAREMLAERLGNDARRENAADRTGALIAPFILAPNLSAGTNASFENYPVTASSADGTVYVTASASQQIVSFKDGKVSGIALPRQSKMIRLVRSPDGGVYTVCFAPEFTTVLEMPSGKSVGRLDVRQSAEGQPVVTIAREATGLVVRVVHTEYADAKQFDVIPLGGGRAISRPLVKKRIGLHEGPDGRIYASDLTTDKTRLRVWDFDSGKTILETPFTLMSGRDPGQQVRITADGAGGLHVLVQAGDGMLEHHDLTKKTMTQALPTIGTISHEATALPGDGQPRYVFQTAIKGKGTSFVSFNPATGAFTPLPANSRSLKLGRWPFTASDGNAYAVSQSSFDVKGIRKSRLYLQDVMTGETKTIELHREGLQELHSVETTPDGRAYALMKTTQGNFAIVQIYGSPPKRQ